MDKIKRYDLDPYDTMMERMDGGWVLYEDVAKYLPENQVAEAQAKIDVKEVEAQARVVLAYLNEATGRAYRATVGTMKLVVARLNEGYTVQDCKDVIELKNKNDFFVERGLVNPVSLFRVSNFDRYLQESKDAKVVRQGNPPGWAQKKILELEEQITVIANGVRGLPADRSEVIDAKEQIEEIRTEIARLRRIS